MEKKQQVIDKVILFYLLAFLFIGLFLQTPGELMEGLKNIVASSGILVSDFVVIGGIGPTFVNGALVGLIGFVLLKVNHVPMVGASIAAIFTMMGFAFFGKNIFNILPVIAGVYLYSRYTRKSFKAYIYPALYGTALAPLVSEVAMQMSLGIVGGILIGVIAGMIIPPLATHLLSAHEGHNLYNIGFTAGFVGFLLTNVLKIFSFDPQPTMIWGTTDQTSLRFVMIFVVVSLIAIGFFLNDKSFNGYTAIFKESGVLVTDFTAIMGPGNTLINMGLVGIIGMLYIEVVNGHYNGATLGGLFTMIGFGAFGKQPKNIYPLMLGVFLATYFSTYNLNDPGPLLAGLFVTTIAPLAGHFGPIIGVMAGFAHFSVVNITGAFHGGLNLYNNGFTAGLIATIFIGVINGYREENRGAK